MTPDEHAAAAEAELTRAEASAVESQLAGYRAAVHATLAIKSGTGDAYARAEAALADADADPDALVTNAYLAARMLAERADDREGAQP